MLGEHQKAREPVQFTPIDFLVGYDVAQALQRPSWNRADFLGKTFGHQ